MAFQNIDNLNLGDVLQIVFTNGIRNQISEDFRDWENIKRKRVGNNDAREIRFLFQKTYGASAIQSRNPGQTNRPFPSAQQATISENTAVVKEIEATIEIEQNLFDRATRNKDARYLEPLALEIDSKRIAAERYLSRMLYSDGTGVYGTVASVDESAIATGSVVVTLDTAARGFVGWFELGDIMYAYTADATTLRASDTNGLTALRVADRDRDANTVTLTVVDASGAPSTAETTTAIAAGDVFYRNTECPVDLTAITGDYNTLSNEFAGLESLTANDGRIVHGIEMSGSCKGSRANVAGSITLPAIASALDKAKLAAGESKYRYTQMMLSPENHTKLINDRETDRRFVTVEDTKRGGHYFVFQHRGDSVKAEVSEFCPQNRVYMMPEDKSSGEKCVELHGSDFRTVKAAGQGDFMLKPAAGGSYSNMLVSFLQSTAVLIAKQPNAIAVLEID